jgi:hypothetical protein
MAAVVARYGETGTVPYLLPLSVDGLIIVASVSLVELAGRRRDTAPALVAPEAHTAAALTSDRTRRHAARAGQSGPGRAGTAVVRAGPRQSRRCAIGARTGARPGR